MTTVDRATMEAWIRRVFELNAAYERLLGLPSEQLLGPPAAEAEIADFEGWIGFSLPPTYRVFLSLHNGWRCFQADISLLSIAEQRQGEAADFIASWKADSWVKAEPLVIEGLVIGIELYTAKAYITDASHTDDRGEMEVVYYNNFETDRYPDFFAMLQKKAEYMEEFIAEEQRRIP
jgi:hypothetical protein